MPENYDDIAAYRIKPVFKCEEDYTRVPDEGFSLLLSTGCES